MSGPRPHQINRPQQGAGSSEFPVVIDSVGQPISPRSEDYIEGHQIGEDHPFAWAGLVPMGWDRQNSRGMDGSRMVGWTVHHKGKGSVVAEHAFSINPQAINRTPQNRNQLFATQGGFYVDDFGEGSETITITQLVAHGRNSTNGGSAYRRTMRDDVIRFYDQIYTRVSSAPGQYDLFFHDNHFWANLDARVPEAVYFPAQSVQIMRAVSLNNVWQLQITMGTLKAPPAAVQSGLPTPSSPKVRTYIVRRGETLQKLAYQLASSSLGGHGGKRDPGHGRALALQNQIVTLTAKYGNDDIRKNRTLHVYSPQNPVQIVGTVSVKRMHVAQGEKIILPAG